MFVALLAVMLAQSPPPSPPQFLTVTTTDSATGHWKALDRSLLANLVAIRRSSPLPALPRSVGAILVNGDRIPGEFLLGDDTAVILKSHWNPNGLRLPLPAIRVLWLTPIPAGTPDFPDRYTWLDEKRRTDVVLLRNGDTVIGDIVAFTNNGKLQIRKTIDGSTAMIEISAMSAIAFNPSLSAVRKVKGPYARIVLEDGSRISLANPTADATTLKGAALFGTALEIPVRELVALDVLQGKATFLADIQPKSESIEPYNDLAWPWQSGRTVKHRPIRLRTNGGLSTFDKGIGTHPKTTLTYALNGKYRTFTALVGLDAETGQRGQVKISILVDGKLCDLPELATLSAAKGPIPVSVSVEQAKAMSLVIDFGPLGDLQADVNWADARLIE